MMAQSYIHVRKPRINRDPRPSGCNGNSNRSHDYQAHKATDYNGNTKDIHRCKNCGKIR